jgi:hypothetical protein
MAQRYPLKDDDFVLALLFLNHSIQESIRAIFGD